MRLPATVHPDVALRNCPALIAPILLRQGTVSSPFFNLTYVSFCALGFSDNASDVSSSYSPHIEYPNSFPSSPSLSPVHSAFSEFNISEPPPEDRNLLLGDTSLSARPRSWSYSPATPQYDNNDQRPRSSSVVGSTLAFQQDMSTFNEGFATQGQQNTFGFSGNYNTANFNIASSSITPSNYNNNYTAGFDVNSIPTSSSNYDGYNSVGLDLTSSTVPSQQFDNNLGYGLSPLPPSSSVTMDNFQFYGQPTNVDRAPHPHDVSQGLANFSNNLSIPSSSNHRPRSASLGGNSQMEPSHLDHEYAHGAFLDVPVLHAPRALQRKGAHRRGATHTGINHHSHMGAGRGRSLGPPSPRSLSGSRSSDRSQSPYPSPSPSIPGSPLPNSNASSLYNSPLIPALPSEALGDIPDLNIMVIPPDDASLGRRHTSAGAGGSGQTDEHQLRRVQSDPFAATRGQKHAAQPTHRRTRSGRGRGGAKSQVMGEMPMMNFAEAGPSNPYAESAEYDPPSPSGGSSNGGDTSFKHQVASGKIVAASHKRRKHPGKFVCEICEADFTAKHNLQSMYSFLSPRRVTHAH